MLREEIRAVVEGELRPHADEWEAARWFPNEVFGRSGNDLLSGDLGNDRLDGGPGVDTGSGGYHDGRIDWITSVESPDYCDSRPVR